MGIVILFDKHRKKAGNSPQGRDLTDEELAERKLKMQQQFYDKYHDILAAAPESPAARIKYLSEIMCCIAPFMFTRDWSTRFFALMDFEDMLLLEFSAAVNGYKKVNSIPDKTAAFPFFQIPYDKLEDELYICLRMLISLVPGKNTGDSNMVIQQAAYLSDIYYSISNMFNDELEFRTRQGLPQLNCYDRAKWVPPFLASWPKLTEYP